MHEEIDLSTTPDDFSEIPRLKQDVVEEILKRVEQWAREYDKVQPGSPNLIHSCSDTSNREWMILEEFQTQKEHRLFFAISKEWKIFRESLENGSYPARMAGEKIEKIKIGFYRDRQMSTEAAEFHLEHEGNSWDLSHRLVEEAYRKKGFGSGLREIAEGLVQAYATMKNREQIIRLNAGQPNVLKVFNRKGYQPHSPLDAEKLKRIQENPESLEWDHAYVRVYAQDGSPTDRWEPQKEKDLYCFEPGVNPHIEQTAFRVILEKKLRPQKDKVEQIEKTQSSIKASLPIDEWF